MPHISQRKKVVHKQDFPLLFSVVQMGRSVWITYLKSRKISAFQMYYPPSLCRKARCRKLAVIQKICYNQEQ